MRFDFLYDRRRRIFSIGYRLADADGPGRLDGSFYDLLASEARLASFVAIAKGDVPQHHWFHLGRLVTNVDGRATLMSWGGTMFEYLMPLLLMRSFPGTLLDQSCRASVRRQIEYGRQRGVPWGISESAYAFTDRDGQLSVPGVRRPGLGLKRGLVDDLVVAPYATALASLVDPGGGGGELRAARARRASTAASASTRRSTTARAAATSTTAAPDAARAAGRRPRLLRAPPGHVARRARQRRLRRRVRRAVPRRSARPGDRAAAAGARAARGHPVGAAAGRERDGAAVAAGVRVAALPVAAHDEPAHALPLERPLHHGAHATPAAASACGATWRSRGGARIRRPTPARTSSTCAIRGRATSGRRPTSRSASEPDQFEATFDLDKVTFRRRDGDIETQLEITVSSEDDVEVRRLSITNRGDRTREIEVTSYAEIVLARPEDDLAHPAFGKLFIETEFDPQSAGLLFSRRPRAADESPVVGFHVLGVDGRARRRRRVGDRPRAVHRPRALARQSRSRSTAARCRARPARCSIRSARCASASGWRRARSSA